VAWIAPNPTPAEKTAPASSCFRRNDPFLPIYSPIQDMITLLKRNSQKLRMESFLRHSSRPLKCENKAASERWSSGEALDTTPTADVEAAALIMTRRRDARANVFTISSSRK
jgi:hypothetical protein